MYREILSCHFKAPFVTKGIPRQGYFRVEKKNQDKGEENLHKTVEVKRTRKNPEKRIQDKSENRVRLSGRKKSWGKDKKIFGKKRGEMEEIVEGKVGEIKNREKVTKGGNKCHEKRHTVRA